MKSVLLLSFLTLVSCQYQQGGRVAPGVPPNQYQPPPPNQQHHVQHHQQQHVPQHQQFQNQQVPQHVQQVPQQGIPQNHGGVQQTGVPQQFNQGPPPPQQGHGHNHGVGNQPGFMDMQNVLKEREHIQEHMQVPIDTSQMSEQELQFHYFKMHDADNNNKLDGCELVKSLIHWHDQSNHDPRAGHSIPEPKIFGDEELIQMIDPILQNDDKNHDGMIDYTEFSLAQANAAARGNNQQQKH